MPYNRSYVNEKLRNASERNKITFAEDNIKKYLFNDVLIVNRWVVNALYSKLLLMNFSNFDRFYLNYFISRIEYPLSELENY